MKITLKTAVITIDEMIEVLQDAKSEQEAFEETDFDTYHEHDEHEIDCALISHIMKKYDNDLHEFLVDCDISLQSAR
jgi:hypothetical protein